MVKIVVLLVSINYTLYLCNVKRNKNYNNNQNHINMEAKVQRLSFTTGEFEECKKHPALEVGTIVISFGAGMCMDKWAVMDENFNLVKISPNNDGYFSHPFHQLDIYAQPIEKKFGIGFYYDLNEPKATAEEIAAAVERANEFIQQCEAEKKRKAEEWSAKKAEVRQKYSGEFEELTDRYGSETHVAKNIRKDLAKHFPGQKFSVRKNSYSHIDVTWADGPTEAEVKEMIGKHRYSRRRDDWNDDIIESVDTAFTAVFGGVDYLWTNRTVSAARVEAIEREILSICPQLSERVRFESLRQFDGFESVENKYGTDMRNANWLNARDIATWYLQDISFYEKPAPKEQKAGKQETTASADGLTLVDYSEKAFAIIGNTKPISETLKELGGRFNFRLSCGPGWIFSKTKLDAVKQQLNLA